MGKRSSAWQHGSEVEGEKGKVRCNYCTKVVQGITRLRHHILGTSNDVTTCPAAPEEAKIALRAPDQGEPAGREEDNAIGEVPLLELEPEINTKVALKGLKGDCTEDAAFAVYARCTAVPCQTVEEALQVVESHQADEAIIPIENSFGGSFAENYDLIYDHSLHIVAEVSIATNLCILALAGVKLEELTRVLGSPEELAQANSYLSNLGVQTEIVSDDLRDTQFTRLSTREQVGIIANAKAAEVYALSVLAEGIQGANASITRFWIVGREPIAPRTGTSIKTSIAFTLDGGAKELPQALLVFNLRKLKVTKVEFRPQRNRPSDMASSSTGQTASKCFNYLYFVDLEYSLADSGSVEKALDHLKEFATSVRVLGVYPVTEVNREV